METFLIPPKDIPEFWHEIKPLIDKALSNGEEQVEANDLLPGLMNGQGFLWLVTHDVEFISIALGEFVEYPRKKSFYIQAWATKSGYQFDKVYPILYDELTKFAKINGCDFIEARVRKGLAKKLKNMEWNDKHSLTTYTLR